jgi:hypothetical protein
MKDTEVFKGKTLTGLLEDIHTATLDKRSILKDMIDSLRLLIKDADSAVMIGPILKEYIDVLVRSDEGLVKIATIVQRIISAEAFQGGKSGDLNDILTDAEKEKLLAEVVKDKADALDELKVEIDNITKELAAPLPELALPPQSKVDPALPKDVT